jgi:hypothetical protein
MRLLLIFFAIFLLLSGRPAEKMRPVTAGRAISRTCIQRHAVF